MYIRAEDITIAITVYRRLDYLHGAISSALAQTIPVRVRLHDDGVQDVSRLNHLLGEFRDRLEYVRHPKTLGLFGSMNAAIETCPTPWLSVLHDDDLLLPHFVEDMLEAAHEVNDAALFFGGTVLMDAGGHPIHRMGLPKGAVARRLEARDFVSHTLFTFPGNLIHAPTALKLGGFPRNSIYTGDWELWFKLALERGAVQVPREVCHYRCHAGADRGTNTATARGRTTACRAMQYKRNVARLRSRGHALMFDRAEFLRHNAPTYRELLVHGRRMPKRLLTYNRRLLLATVPTTHAGRLLRLVSRFAGNSGLRLSSLLYPLYARFFRTPDAF